MRPLGFKVSSFRIQKFPFCLNIFFLFSVLKVLLQICSIIIKLASHLKLLSFIVKWREAGIASALYTFLCWLFSLKLTSATISYIICYSLSYISIQICSLRCYVDYIFVPFKSKEHLKLFVNYMNSKDKNIKFTFETEDSKNFSFLDVKITCKNKPFVTSIFCESTVSRLLLISIVLFLIPTI